MDEGHEFVGTRDALKVDDLDRVERELGFKFPRDVRAHYLEHNGGRPRRGEFRKGGESYRVREFLPIKYEDRQGRLEDAYIDLRDDEEIVDCQLVPFACDNRGDYYCFSIRPRDHGAIYAFRCDVPDPDDMLLPLAGSFREFMDGLR